MGLGVTAAGAQARAEGHAIEAEFESQLRGAPRRDPYQRLCRLLEDSRPILAQLKETRAGRV